MAKKLLCASGLLKSRDNASCECAYGFTSLMARQATPHQVLDLIRPHWQIENVLHWRRDVTLGEDACQVSRGQTPAVLAALNNLVLFLNDHTGSRNAAETIRTFAAHPAKALALIMSPIRLLRSPDAGETGVDLFLLRW